MEIVTLHERDVLKMVLTKIEVQVLHECKPGAYAEQVLLRMREIANQK